MYQIYKQKTIHAWYTSGGRQKTISWHKKHTWNTTSGNKRHLQLRKIIALCLSSPGSRYKSCLLIIFNCHYYTSSTCPSWYKTQLLKRKKLQQQKMPLLDHKQHHFVYRQTGLLATQTLANWLNKSCHSSLQSVELTGRDRNMTKGQSKTYQLLQKSHIGGVWKVIEKPHKGDTISNNTLPRLPLKQSIKGNLWSSSGGS